MTLPADPYEVTTQQLIEANRADLEAQELRRAEAEAEADRIRQVIRGLELALEEYRSRRPALHTNGSNPYQDEAMLGKVLRGLTGIQGLIRLGLLNDRHLIMKTANPILHRHGVMKGKWKHVPGRAYTIVQEHPEVFQKHAPGEFDILPGAEAVLRHPGRRIVRFI